MNDLLVVSVVVEMVLISDELKEPRDRNEARVHPWKGRVEGTFVSDFEEGLVVSVRFRVDRDLAAAEGEVELISHEIKYGCLRESSDSSLLLAVLVVVETHFLIVL